MIRRIILAFKAFIEAIKHPEKAEQFLKSEVSPVKTSCEQTHLRLLNMLQQSSRLIDFLKEDLASFDDAQVGAAVRKIHDECGKCLEDLVTIRPLMDENEGAKINVPQGYDPTKIKVVGKVKGNPPFAGILVHRGWKAHKRSLPLKVGESVAEVICPAEVEIR